jgi:hypothetical protein
LPVAISVAISGPTAAAAFCRSASQASEDVEGEPCHRVVRTPNATFGGAVGDDVVGVAVEDVVVVELDELVELDGTGVEAMEKEKFR